MTAGVMIEYAGGSLACYYPAGYTQEANSTEKGIGECGRTDHEHGFINLKED